MIKNIFFVVLASIICLPVLAQTNVQLNINHKLGETIFELETNTKNNLDQSFRVTRLEYYLSKISIIHDGGMETNIDDLYVLVDATEETQIDLGNHNITEIEGIKFGVGVDSEVNHNDPASYPSDHPLAPQVPSMHWGWASGYKFMTLEGLCENNEVFQLHGLGDANYKPITVEVSALATEGEIAIYLDADYTRSLEDIDLTTGFIAHGEEGNAQKSLNNTKNLVFSAGIEDTTDTAIESLEMLKQVSIIPNPASAGRTMLNFKNLPTEGLIIKITDIQGKEVAQIIPNNSAESVLLDIQNAGLYFVHLIQEGKALGSTKFIVQ